ncbi:MAG: dynamin family protein [Anaerolineae bacterium]|nr:dynamin family protein [Anaerolineae bacterium]MDW8173054.1 dynamin family protein [Anaerolineae bacterium]
MSSPALALEGYIVALREEVIRLLSDMADSLSDEGETSLEDRQRLRDMARDLREMFFMVAVIGEFNAGKSTFVNALIGESLLPMGITPTTEHIELIRYNEVAERVPTMRDDGVREWAHPNIGAQGVAIVDTPGTGSVFQRHEKTAKAFLHRSDLVLFIISARQAFAESERAYLELARQYSKKIILVINQIDTLTPAEQVEVRRFVMDQVKETLQLEPMIFLTSARNALQGLNDEGMDGLRAYLRSIYADMPPAEQKLLAQLKTAEGLLSGYQARIRQRIDLVKADSGQLGLLEQELEHQSFGIAAQMAQAQADIVTAIEGIRARGLAFIDEHFTFKKLGSDVDRQQLQVDFQERVIGRAGRDVEEATNRYINAVIDQSRAYWRSVIERLNRLRELLAQEASAPDQNIYAQQRESLQEAIHIAEAELKSYASGAILSEMEAIFNESVSGFRRSAIFAAFGVIAAALGLLTPGPLVGLGAAPLAAPALVAGAAMVAVFGVPAYRYLRRITTETKRDFNARLDLLSKNYNAALQDLTNRERQRLLQFGKQILVPIFSRLEALAEQYRQQEAALAVLAKRLNDLRDKITSS